jgi:hypothetical protein
MRSAPKHADVTAALTIRALLGSRYCDICGGMPWWEQPLLVVTGLLIAMAILTGLVRLSDWLSRSRRPGK